MSAANLKALYNIAPGFRDDKDEKWIQHLVLADKTQMRKLRANFIMLYEKLDGLKLERKEYNSTAPKHKELTVQIVEQTKIVDKTIQGLLLTLTSLREKAFKVRDAEERQQVRAKPRLESASFDPVLSDVFLPGSLSGFLPQSLAKPKPKPEPTPKHTTSIQPETMEVSSQSSIEETSAVDFYLLGVEEKHVPSMKKLRPLNEKFDCKDRAYDALIRLDLNDRNLAILESIKVWERETKQKSLADNSAAAIVDK